MRIHVVTARVREGREEYQLLHALVPSEMTVLQYALPVTVERMTRNLEAAGLPIQSVEWEAVQRDLLEWEKAL